MVLATCDALPPPAGTSNLPALRLVRTRSLNSDLCRLERRGASQSVSQHSKLSLGASHSPLSSKGSRIVTPPHTRRVAPPLTQHGGGG